MKRRLPFLLVACAAALAGCGGGGGGDAAEVEAAVRTLELSHDPSKCTEAVTPNLLEQAFQKSGPAGVRECEKEVRDPSGRVRSATVSGIEVEGATATAEVSPRGGSFDRQTVSMSLVKGSGGRWKVDRLSRLTEFDRAPLLAALHESLSDDDDSDPGQVRCIVSSMRRASRADVEGVLLHSSEEASVRVARRCPRQVPGASDRERVVRVIGKFLTGRDPALCLELATPRYLEQAVQRSGLAAIKLCEAVVHGRLAYDSAVRVSKVRVEGSRARANAEFLLGAYKRQVLAVALVEDRGHWKLDRTLGYVQIDRDALVAAGVEELEALGVDVTPRISACIRRIYFRLPRPTIESLLLNPSPARSKRLFGACVGEALPEQAGQL